MSATVASVNISTAKGTCKTPVPSIHIDATGVVGDAHAGSGLRAVSLLSTEQLTRFHADKGRLVQPGEFAENITTHGLDLGGLALLDYLQVGQAELQVSQIGKSCHGEGCAIFREVGTCVMPKEGIFCRVIRGGEVKPGAAVVFRPRPLKVAVITLSDRASAGIYEDRSGPRIVDLVRSHLGAKRWHLEVERQLIPDQADLLLAHLRNAVAQNVDVILTTGGTGVSPRDITPDTVAPLLEKTLPGVMEYIRVTCGATNPRALLSRGVAGLIGQTQVYTLPGSVRAVEEYMAVIGKVLEHTLLTCHGLA
jgi:molybdenum cofactor synthesis domain-containing protein